jgi:hypothetical protein
MTEDTVSQAEDTVSRAEYANLQEQLKVAKAERDRQIFEKSEIVTKANAYAKERDDLRESLAAAIAERDRYAAERAELAGKAQDAARQAADAARRAEEAAAEIARLQHVIDTAPSNDPTDVILKLARDKTNALVVWVRGKIPPDSPMAKHYDAAVETTAQIGGAAVTIVSELYKIVAPEAVKLVNWGKRELEARTAKKEG